MKLSLSFDDGCKEDLILAEKLSKLDIQATFFIPKNNIEGRKATATENNKMCKQR